METRRLVAEQFEYYFSDENLPGDAFLLKLMAKHAHIEDGAGNDDGNNVNVKDDEEEQQQEDNDEQESCTGGGGDDDENGDGKKTKKIKRKKKRKKKTKAKKEKVGLGFVPIKTLASFNKVKQLSHDPALILAALRESALLAVTMDGKYVRRVAPIPAEWLDVQERRKRCVNVSQLPPGASVESLAETFSEHGTVVQVRIHQNGIAVVEFSDEENAVACARAHLPKKKQKARGEQATSWRRGPAAAVPAVPASAAMRVTWAHSKKLPKVKHSGGIDGGRDSVAATAAKKGQWVFDDNTGTYVAANEFAKAEMDQIEEESKDMGWGSRFKPREQQTSARRQRLQLKKRGASAANGAAAPAQGGDEFTMTYAKGPDESRVKHPDGTPGFSDARGNKARAAAEGAAEAAAETEAMGSTEATEVAE